LTVPDITIHKAQPRTKTPRLKLSDLSWKRGIGTFFFEEVPFSYSTGKSFSSSVYQLVKLLREDNAPFRVNECGAGMGMLVKNVLDAAAADDPDAAKTIKVDVSEYSETLIKQLHALGVYNDYLEQVTIEQVNVLEPKLSLKNIPDLMIWSYLIDSLPTHHFELRNNRLYELQIESKLTPNSSILDTTKWPPEKIDAKAIKKILNSGDEDELAVLSSKLAPLIREKWVKTAIGKCPHFTKKDKALLKDFKKYLGHDGPFRFNACLELDPVFKNLSKQLNDDSVLLIYDFGHRSKSKEIKKEWLVVDYSVCRFFSVSFPFVQFCAERHGFNVWLSTHKEGESQVMLMSKKPFSKDQKSAFKEVFSEEGIRSIQKVNKKFEKESPDLSKWKIKDYDTMLKELNPLTQQSFFLQMTVASKCVEVGNMKVASHILDQAIENYGPVAISAYLLRAKLNKGVDKEQQYKDLAKVLEMDPICPLAHNDLSLLLAEDGQYDHYISHAKEYIKWTRSDKVWQQLFTIALVLLELKKNDEAAALLNWIIETKFKNKFVVPSSIRVKADKVYKAFCAPPQS